jgi:hypothetical protein
VGIANEDLLYAVVDGRLMEFSRSGEDDRWEFLSVIKT